MSQNSSNPIGPEAEAPKAPAPRRSIKRALGFGVLLPVWVLASFLLAQLLVAALWWATQQAGISFGGINEIVLNSVMSAIIYAVTLAMVIGVPWAIQRRRTSLEEVGLQRAPDWLDILWAPGGMVMYYVLSAIVMLIAMTTLTFVDYTQAQQTGFSGINTQLEYILAFMSLVIIAPVAEEVLFRGYLFGKLRKHMTLIGAILITSILFAAVHLQWNVAFDTFALSIVLCLLRVWTGSLWASILLHALKNGVAFYLLFINPSLMSTIGG